MAKSIVRLIVEGDTKGAQKALKDAQNQAGKTGAGLKEFAKVAAASFVAAGAAAIEFGKAAVKAADQEDAAHARLLTALKNTKQSWKDEKAAIDAVDASSVKFGYDTADTENALALAETATKNTAKSTVLLAIAQNLAAFKGIDLQTAMMAVIKASEGQSRALKQLGVDIPTVNGSAQAIKTTFIAWGTAQQNLLDIQKQSDSQTTNVSLKNDAAVATAKQNLLYLEQRLHGEKSLTISQEQELVRAQEAVRTAEGLAASAGVSGASQVEKAQQAVTRAHQKYLDTVNAGTLNTSAVASAVSGQAAAQAATFQGKVKTLHAEWDDFEADMGNKIIPFLVKGMKKLSDPKTLQDIQAFGYGVEEVFVGEANAVIDLINVLIRAHNTVTGIEKDLHLPHGGHIDTIGHLAAPKPPTLPGNATTGLTPMGKLIAAWMQENPGKPLPPNLGGPPVLGPGVQGPLAPGESRAMGPAAPSVVVQAGGTYVANGGVGTMLSHDAKVNASKASVAMKRHAKRNGKKAPNAKYTAFPS